MSARRSSKPLIAILGAGIAGLTAAHELVERGYDVVLCERRKSVGGKSRSYDARIRVRNRTVRVPAEHGFRLLPSFYRHLDDTMARIPLPEALASDGRRTVSDYVVGIRDELLAFNSGQSITLPVATEYALEDVGRVLGLPKEMLTVGVTQRDLEAFAGKVWQLITSCPERRATEYEGIGWREFVQAPDRSDEYYWYLATGLTRALVAARARRASTKTIGNVALRLMACALDQGNSADRVLTGPTSEVWLEPWLEHIQRLAIRAGGKFDLRLGCEVVEVEMSGTRIERVVAREGGRRKVLKADIYVSALPLEILAGLLQENRSFRKSGGEQATRLLELADPANGHFQWMSGLQIYLRKDVPINRGHQLFFDSPWGLTSISQRQFWRDGFLPPGVGGVLSIDISNWEAPGLGDAPPANQCTREQVFAETLRQLRAALPAGTLADENIVGWSLDAAIRGPNPSGKGGTGVVSTNLEPILVNGTNTWRLRPTHHTPIDNFYIAGDFVRTETDLACMEGANEAARRVVNDLLERFKYQGARCMLEVSKEPPLLTLFQRRDERRYARGLPWSDINLGPSLLLGVQAADQFLDLAFPSLRPKVPAAPRPPAPVLPNCRPRAEWDDRESGRVQVQAVDADTVTRALGTKYARAGRADPMFKRWRAFLLEKSKTTLVPFHVYDGSALIIHGLADYEELMAQTAGTGYAPVAAQLADGKGRKRGYAQLWIMQYADTTEGPYAEVVINFVVSRRQREYAWRSPYSSLVPMMDPDNRLFTIQLLLEEYEPTNLGAIEYGRQLFGLDKRKARISICQRAETRTFACRQGGKRALWGQVSTNNTLFDTVRDTTWLAQEIGILDCLKNAKQMRDGAELNGGMVTRDINNPGSTLEILAVYKFSPEILRWDPGGKLGWSAETSFGRILDAMDFQPKIACRDDRLRSVLYRKGWPVAEVA